MKYSNLKKTCFLVAALAMGSSLGLAAEKLTYKDLVSRLTDMEHIALLPQKGEIGALASSWDRASKYDEATGKYVGWGANGDGGGIIRKEGDTSVFAEIKGPGVIWRTWSATANKGHVKIYLDGSETPTVDLPFIEYFNREAAPFTRKNLVYITKANGLNNYTPISFQKSCKIVADPDWGAYYHFNYTQFPEGTEVPTFKLPLSAEDEAALDEADRIFAAAGENPAKALDQKTETKTVTAEAGKSVEVIKLTGAQAITGLKVKIADLPKDIAAQRMLLAQLTISIAWDKEAAPSVWAPLGDFFGSSAGATPFKTLAAGVLDDGTLYVYWFMPFAKEAVVTLGNDSDTAVSTTWEVSHAPLKKSAKAYARFHAKWHRNILPELPPDRNPDWMMVQTEGKGRYVGTQLHVWNPRGGWWGEGDEKFFVDGEKFPSTLGTGSEDYFGYAWSSGGTFIQGLHSQPVNEGNQGHVSVNRWHIADNIPFQTSFEGIIEKYFTEKDRDCQFACVAFWYLDAAGKDPYGVLPVSERAGWWAKPEITREPGVIEGEQLRPTERTEHGLGGDLMLWAGRNLWSGDEMLIWRSEQVGEKVELNLPDQKAGKYKLIVRATKGPDFGIFQLSVNGEKVGAPQDLYGDHVAPADVVELGEVTLPEGKSTLGVEVTGKNEASRHHFFGLDYIKLVPVQ